jgi:hypothetical protein
MFNVVARVEEEAEMLHESLGIARAMGHPSDQCAFPINGPDQVRDGRALHRQLSRPIHGGRAVATLLTSAELPSSDASQDN